MRRDIQAVASASVFIELLNFSGDGSSFNFIAYAESQKILITLKEILNVNFSRDSLDGEVDDGIDVLEFSCEYRAVTEVDLKNYPYHVEDIEAIKQLYCITIHGSGSLLKILCKKVEIQDSE
jgi:hypothetical protein